jgi:hypothetical protein
MWFTIIMMILGISLIALAVTYFLPRKKAYFIPMLTLLGLGLIMIGLSQLAGIKDNWSSTILIVFGMIFIFSSILTAITLIFLSLSKKKN